MRIPPELIDQVRSEVNILDVVSQKVQLHKSGKNWFGFCPFHPETTPSFSVNEQKQIFNCFSCHRGGNVFKFVMETEGLTFPEAFQKVAEMSGISLDSKYTQLGSLNAAESSENGKIISLYAQATQLYHHILVNTELGEEALNYLHDRGLNDDMINEFNLGFAPTTDILKNFVKEKQIDYQVLRKSGLFVERPLNADDPVDNLNDRFKDRVMFPINDANGHPIAFSGRALHTEDKTVPKYLNSPETPIFNKRRVLFNLDKAKATIRQTKSVILFEGFMDVLAAYRAGVKNGVASMGTSLTDEQIGILAHQARKLSICYDGDDPGQNATKRALEIIRPSERFDLEVINLPDKLDPDEVVKKYGEEKFREIVQNQHETPLSFFMHFYARNRNLENENDQLAYISDILKELVTVKDPIERDLYLNRLASKFGVEYRNLESQLQSLMAEQQAREKTNPRANAQTPEQEFANYQKTITTVTESFEKPKYSRVERAERLLLYRMLHERDVWFKVRELEDFNFIHQSYQTLYLLAEEYFNHDEEFDDAKFLEMISDDQLHSLATELLMEEYQGMATDQEIEDCISLIMNEYPLDEKIKHLDEKIKKAKRMNDSDNLMSLIMEKTNLLRQKDLMKSGN